MRVEVTEKKLKDGGYDLVEGDAITVPDEFGAAWCARGWAKDIDGQVPTGERVAESATLKPTKARHSNATKEI